MRGMVAKKELMPNVPGEHDEIIEDARGGCCSSRRRSTNARPPYQAGARGLRARPGGIGEEVPLSSPLSPEEARVRLPAGGWLAGGGAGAVVGCAVGARPDTRAPR